MKIKKNILPKLCPEGQKWINSLTGFELRAAEHMVDIVGEESFVQHWRAQKEKLDEMRHLFGRVI